MKELQNTRFGEIEYDPEQTLHFPEGIIGFEALREFIVISDLKEGPLFWIQSVDDPGLAFVLTDPTNFFPEYQVGPNKSELEKLDIQGEDECHPLAVVTIGAGGQDVRLNLFAPILFAPESNRAIQVVLENSPYQSSTPIPKVGEEKEEDPAP